ncbi:MAG TPA: Gfo/Idh/MocA family oxidoreductase, partial [Acetobacteraceae bacterium]|nr:Gfo/Idh/MocA family oxidoreductase [Acetobacteraceae bacterium]
MSTRFRVAVIGAGIGAAHVEGYLANAPGFEVAVVCDLDEARAAAVAATAPGAETAASYHAVLARGDIDLVDICLPPYLHLQAIETALAAGKHVLCEKPLVGSLSQVERVMRAQGNRISEQGQQPRQVGVIPAGPLELSAQRALRRVLLHDIQRHVAE